MKRDCDHFRTFVTGYIDDELDAETKSEVGAHLKKCGACNEEYLRELRVKEVLQEKLAREKAPAYLRSRIRRQIARHGQRPGFLELVRSLFVYQPVPSAMALAMIALLVFVPSYRLLQPWVDGIYAESDLEVFSQAELTGELICLDCEFLSHTAKGMTKHDASHRPGLKAEDGRIWTFLQSRATRELMAGRSLFERRKAVVTGVAFTNARYIQVEQLKLL